MRNQEKQRRYRRKEENEALLFYTLPIPPLTVVIAKGNDQILLHPKEHEPLRRDSTASWRFQAAWSRCVQYDGGAAPQSGKHSRWMEAVGWKQLQ